MQGAQNVSACASGSISADGLDQLNADLGQSVVVDGTVATTDYASGSTGSPTFLDFHDPYQGYFKVVIWGENRNAFSTAPEDYYNGKHVCVTGTLSSYEGPEIVVTTPAQIVVVDSGASGQQTTSAFSMQASNGAPPCYFPSTLWNGGSGTESRWDLPSGLAPISSCSFKVVITINGATSEARVTFRAHYGQESVDANGVWHVQFIPGASVACSAVLPATHAGSSWQVTCTLSAPRSDEYMGDYTYAVS